MTEPQSWTLIATFTAAIFGMLTLFSVMLTRVIRAEISGVRGEIGGLRSEMLGETGGLRSEMRGEIGALRGEIGGLRGEIVAVEARLSAKFDLLDRDVQAIARRVFPDVE